MINENHKFLSGDVADSAKISIFVDYNKTINQVARIGFQKGVWGYLTPFSRRECMCKDLQAHPRLGRRANILDSFVLLMLGFELDLYSPSEYCMAYWYIHVILMKLAEKIHIKMMMSNENSRRKTKKKRDFERDIGQDHHTPPAVLLFQCYIYIAEGLMLVMMLDVAFEIFRHFCFLTRSTENKEEERFCEGHRKGPSDSPCCFIVPVLHYFAEAELRRIEQVAEHNGIALNLICRLGTLEPSLKVSFEFTHHPYLAVAVVKRS
ncbi:unnamed protein product [Fraxinus pennsylvanica]|uniref:NAA35-like TPR repeats domain-containing protein n=1 Tax=Fraxinus pennsylvanica TaxID=56036 RepID=A0AAD2A6Z7_9LAMI|nr:unnamed protein product [Fraxinus pennsylvanica]